MVQLMFNNQSQAIHPPKEIYQLMNFHLPRKHLMKIAISLFRLQCIL